MHFLVKAQKAIKFEDELVYDSDDQNDSFAFLLYRDGINSSHYVF